MVVVEVKLPHIAHPPDLVRQFPDILAAEIQDHDFLRVVEGQPQIGVQSFGQRLKLGEGADREDTCKDECE